MNLHLTQQLAGQHEADLRRLAASSGHTQPARRARQTPRRYGHRSHPVRRRASWALITVFNSKFRVLQRTGFGAEAATSTVSDSTLRFFKKPTPAAAVPGAPALGQAKITCPRWPILKNLHWALGRPKSPALAGRS
jgi:hypothetical protein